MVSSNPLRQRVRVRRRGSGLEADAVKRAEQALDELSVNFDDWAEEEVERLLSARDCIVEHGYHGEFAEEIFRACHDLKGESQTFGYPLVARLAASLCVLLDVARNVASPPLELINHHVDAIWVIVRDRVKGEDNTTAITLFNDLAAVTNSYIESAKPADASEQARPGTAA